MTRVSVIIPVYNGARYLAECVASVVSQTLPPVEVIIVDDASTDDTPSIIAALAAQDARIQAIRQPERGGAGAARNRGLAAASGDAIAFIDADDVWLPDKLRFQADHLKAYPNLKNGIIFSMMQRFISPDTPPDVRARLLDDPQPLDGYVPGTMLAMRGVFEQVGMFDPSLPTGEFIDWLMRARRRGVPEAMIRLVGLRRRVHDANHTGTEAGRQYARLIKRHLDSTRAEIEPPPPDDTALPAPPLPPMLHEIITTNTVWRADGTAKALDSHTPIDCCHVLSGLALQIGASRVIEVGMASGISTVALLAALADQPQLAYHVIDPYQDSCWEDVGVLNVERAGFAGRCTLHRTPSELALPALLAQGESFHFAYIDGHHTFDHVMLDFFYINRMLRVGGIVVFDDVWMQSIGRAVGYIRRYPAYQPVAIPSHVRVGEVLIPVENHRRLAAFRKIAEDERPWDWYAYF
jgi:GT2 family glycosyltransferase/predicted O-methyltransferase YrrM